MSGLMMLSLTSSYGSLPINTVAPVVSGTATVGQTLTTTNGTWTGAPTPTFTYQWQRSGSNIGGATSSTYVLQFGDVGNTVRCVVTATNPLGSVSANSNSTGSVADLPFGDAYQGGYYTGKIVVSGTTYAVIVAPKASGESTGKTYQTARVAAPSATITLNNGSAASASMNSASYPAAQFCEGLSIGGYTDWYSPARDELELCWRNLKPSTTNNSTNVRPKSSYTYPEGNDVTGNTMGRNQNSSPVGVAYTSTVPARTSAAAFQTGGAEAFSVSLYWSSSEYATDQGWAQSFGDGNQQNENKDDPYRVRAVRRVAI